MAAAAVIVRKERRQSWWFDIPKHKTPARHSVFILWTSLRQGKDWKSQPPWCLQAPTVPLTIPKSFGRLNNRGWDFHSGFPQSKVGSGLVIWAQSIPSLAGSDALGVVCHRRDSGTEIRSWIRFKKVRIWSPDQWIPWPRVRRLLSPCPRERAQGVKTPLRTCFFPQEPRGS